jgi:hypothetical protein
MLDVNNDKLSSESASGEASHKNEETPLKSKGKEIVADDNKKEDAVLETRVDDIQEPEIIEKELDKKDVEIPKDDVVEEPKDITAAESPVEEATKQEDTKVLEAGIAKEAEKQEDLKAVKEGVDEESEKEQPSSESEPKLADEPAKEVEVPKEAVPSKSEAKDIPAFDLAVLSLDEIVQMMQKLLNEFEIKDVRNQLESLKVAFQKKFKALVQEQKEAFVKAGGEVADFFYSEPVKKQFDELHNEYKRKRQQFYKDLERAQKENLELRLLLIDELKSLIDNAESSTMYKDFKNLQDRWGEVGQIPHGKYNDVWRTYHHHVERFYDLLHLNNDFRDLDFKHNFEEKSKLIAKAEALSQEEDVNHAFKELQVLHRMWKEDIGPVAREFREEVWHKFSEATVDLKLAVIDKIKAIDHKNNKNHKDWQDSIKELESLRDEFFAIGKVPKTKNEEIWQLFRGATRDFNAEKNNFYKGIKKDQVENLKKKMTLVEQAESLKDSEEWDIATEVFKKVQAEWKKIGHVPRQDSDKIWKRFKNACNHYFDRLHEKQNVMDKDQSAIIEKKKEFMESLKEQIEVGKELTLEFVQKGLDDWRALGVLPYKVKHLDTKFHKLLDAAYKKLNIDQDEVSFLRFKSSVDAMVDQRNTRKLDSEQLFIRRKIDDITKEIKQLENNISFISNASEDNPLIRNVYNNIEEYKKSLEIWKRKIDYMRKLEY